MSWEFEIGTEVRLISPNMNIFFAKWRANERNFDKKLGIFDSPNFQGSIIQDLNVKSTYYPLTLYFDGLNNHRDADEFYKSCREEVGQWEVKHPVHGILILQLVSLTERQNIIDNGNFTEVETNWIEPANIERIVSIDESILSSIMAAVNFVNDAITTLKQLRADAYAAIASVSAALVSISGLADKFLNELTLTSQLAQESYETAKTSFNDAIDNFGIDDPDPEDAAQALADLVASPVDASEDMGATLSGYEKVIDGISNLLPENTTKDDFNSVLGLEFGLAAILAAIIKLTVNADYNSRSEIVTAMDKLTDIFNDAINMFDEIQDNFTVNLITNQYFSFSQNYTSLAYMFSLAMQFLINQFYNLKIEKRFTLKTARSPLEITITEYGGLGTDEENYQLFLDSNNLSGDDILLLPANREVVIYE